MQRTLTAELAELSELQVISFRHFDCLVFSRGEILKLFRPTSRRILMGAPRDRRVSGELRLLFEADLNRLKPPSKRFDYSNHIFAAPIENFPSLILHSSLADGAVERTFFERIGTLLQALPSDRAGWQETFGREFFSLTAVIRFLRERVTFHDPVRDEIQFKVSIIEPPRH
jgi:hypothetical protein